MKTEDANADKQYWLDDTRNVNKVVYGLYLVCAMLIAADGFYYKHVHFDFENWFGFFGFFGLIACVGLVLTAKVLRVFLKRSEDYYDE